MDAYQPLHVNDHLKTSLLKMGYRGNYLEALMSAFEVRFEVLPENTIIPENFFDLERTVRIISRREQKTPQEIRDNLTRHMDDVFDVHDLVVSQNKGQEPETLNDKGNKFFVPSDIIIAQAAVASFNKNQRMPTHGHDMLPEGSYAWSHIRDLLKTREPRITLKELIAEHDLSLKKEKIKRRPVPSDEVLTQAAIAYYGEHGNLPNSEGRQYLPENSASWATIYTDLRNRNPSTTLRRLVIAQNIPLKLDLRKVFTNSAIFVANNARIPDIFDRIATNLGTERIDKLLRRGSLMGWEDFKQASPKPPSCYKDFLLNTGLAKMDEHKKIRPATPTEVREAERTFNFV